MFSPPKTSMLYMDITRGKHTKPNRLYSCTKIVVYEHLGCKKELIVILTTY